MKEAIFNNGIRHPPATKENAQQLRTEGRTHREIAKELKISNGSAHLWTKGILLTKEQKRAIFSRVAARVFTPERRAKLSVLARIRRGTPEKYTKEDLLNKIIDFHKQYGRIPLKREFNMYREYKVCFGSWNGAIRAAGFETNPELFAHKFRARDGHSCDSFTEKIIDDWFFDYDILHEKNWKYRGTKMTADFFIRPNIVVEFFGLAGVRKSYDQIIEKKKTFCKRFNLRLIEIYPRDLFPKNHLLELVFFLAR